MIVEITGEGRVGSAKKKAIGFTKFGFVVAVIVILLLITVGLKILGKFLADAERMAMEEVLENLERSVTVLKSTHMVNNDLAGLARFDGANPIKLLVVKPDNYAGELVEELDQNNGKPGGGFWYYDYNRRVLFYQVKHDAHFYRPDGGPGEVGFKLIFTYADNNENGQFERDVDVAQGLRLKSLDEYQWVN